MAQAQTQSTLHRYKAHSVHGARLLTGFVVHNWCSNGHVTVWHVHVINTTHLLCVQQSIDNDKDNKWFIDELHTENKNAAEQINSTEINDRFSLAEIQIRIWLDQCCCSRLSCCRAQRAPTWRSVREYARTTSTPNKQISALAAWWHCHMWIDWNRR